MSIIRTAAVTAAAALLLAACGGDPAPKAKPAEPTKPAVLRASCELEGAYTGQVTLTERKDMFLVEWKGQPVAPKGKTNFAVSVFDKAGERGADFSVDFLDGERIGYFVSITSDTPMVTNLKGDPVVEGDTVSASFPTSAGSLSKIDVAQWGAAYTVDFDSSGTCPKDSSAGFLPFPSKK